MTVVTFDFGQTLAELDHGLVARRIAERGVLIDEARLNAEAPSAWRAYGAAKREGQEGKQAWCTFMRTLLELAGVAPARGSVSEANSAEALAEWLFGEQPTRNLWRAPVAGMFELADELARAGTEVAIVSNSEGRLAELIAEVRPGAPFRVIADSGKLGFEKPDPRIFEWTARELGVELADLVHIGDAWDTDVSGALRVGARAIWFAPDEARVLPERVVACRDADEVRAALRAWDIPPGTLGSGR
jgi:FMN phosphatase YigB (HAD superfamily)